MVDLNINNIIDENKNKYWKNKIIDIFNNDNLIIVYEWFYDIKKNNWNIKINDSFQSFCNDNNIKIIKNSIELLNNINNDKYQKYIFTQSDEYIINNKILSSCNYHQNKKNIINLNDLNPNIKKKKIFIKCCNQNNINCISFPVGIFDRNILDINQIKVYRLRTPESIKKIIKDNYINCKKNIENYIYFLQTVRLNDDSININPLYVEISDRCKSSNIFTHTQNQNKHWHNLNHHLFCLCLSWNTLESPRLWESLYFGCIPIIINYYEPNDFIENYYQDLPILHIKDINNLFSEKFIIEKYTSIMENIENYNFDKLNMNYWKKILK